MSFHESLLNQTYWGINFFSALGLIVTIGIGLSCICRLNAMRPRRWRLTWEQVMYLIFSAWAMEAFTDLLFYKMFSGFDVAIGLGIMLHLHSSYIDWAGDDCICDLFNAWRPKYRERMKEIRRGVNYGRRARDKPL